MAEYSRPETMATIVWLDNRPAEVGAAIDQLRRDGNRVHVVTTEETCIERLIDDEPAELLVQDLHRSGLVGQIEGGPARERIQDPWSAGWRFYAEVLRPYFPGLPVVICTYDATKVSVQRGDEFNLRVVDKAYTRQGALTNVVNDLLASQRTLHVARDSVPNVLLVDFETVTDQLVRHLALNPSDLHNVNWSTFEKLVATLLTEMGYEVDHTPLTRDGGVDLWALKRTDLGEVQYAIDVKKYRPDRVVGPDAVRAIYGVAQAEGASVGMIVTTSRFGRSAQEFANQLRYRLALKDFNDVVRWMRLVGGHESC